MSRGILIDGRSRRRSWSADERRWILEEAFSGSDTPAEVARRHDISTGQLYTWRRRAREGAGLSQANEPQFVPAIVATSPPSGFCAEPTVAPPPQAPAIEIELKKGVKVRIEAGVPASVIAATLKALR